MRLATMRNIGYFFVIRTLKAAYNLWILVMSPNTLEAHHYTVRCMYKAYTSLLEVCRDGQLVSSF